MGTGGFMRKKKMMRKSTDLWQSAKNFAFIGPKAKPGERWDILFPGSEKAKDKEACLLEAKERAVRLNMELDRIDFYTGEDDLIFYVVCCFKDIK
jgi:hypothetical protein